MKSPHTTTIDLQSDDSDTTELQTNPSLFTILPALILADKRPCIAGLYFD